MGGQLPSGCPRRLDGDGDAFRVRILAHSLELLLLTPTLTTQKPLQPQGLFISSVTPINQSISLQYLAPSPSTLPHNRPIKTLSAKPKNPGHTKILLNTFALTFTLIPSTQLINSSRSIAITDAIGSPKPHRHLMPLLWDLIEATIKYKRQ